MAKNDADNEDDHDGNDNIHGLTRRHVAKQPMNVPPPESIQCARTNSEHALMMFPLQQTLSHKFMYHLAAAHELSPTPQHTLKP